MENIKKNFVPKSNKFRKVMKSFRSLIVPMKRKLSSRSSLLPVYTTLPEVLKDDSSLQIFRAFLMKEYSQENLDFILSVDRLLYDFTEEKVRNKAND